MKQLGLLSFQQIVASADRIRIRPLAPGSVATTVVSQASKKSLAPPRRAPEVTVEQETEPESEATNLAGGSELGSEAGNLVIDETVESDKESDAESESGPLHISVGPTEIIEEVNVSCF